MDTELMGRSPSKKKPSFSNERLGQIAQDQIGLFAESAEINKTISVPDRDGWDFHFVVPRPAPLDGSSFFDEDAPLATMFAQVKGSVAEKGRRAVKLSHLRHAATMDTPFFFIVLEFDAPPIPARLFVVPVDEKLIEAIRRRLRREGARNGKAPPKLNKLTMDISWVETHRVPCTSEGLRAALLKHIGDDMRNYAERKRRWWCQAGASSERNHLSFSFKGPTPEVRRRIAEWALGLSDSLEADELQEVQYRWDIPRAFEPKRNVKISLASPSSIGTTRVEISDRDGVAHAEFDAEVFSNLHFTSHFPREYWAIRLQWKFLQIIKWATSGSVKVMMSIPSDQPPLPLYELATMGRAIRLLAESATIVFSTPSISNGREQRIKTARSDAQNQRGEALDAFKMLKAAEAAWCICTLFGVPNDFSITPVALERQAEELEEWALLHTSAGITAEIETDTNIELIEGEVASLVHFHALKLDRFELISAFTAEGKVNIVEGRAKVAAQPQFPRRWVVARRHRDEWMENIFPRLVAELIDEIRSKGKKCVLADSKLLRKGTSESSNRPAASAAAPPRSAVTTKRPRRPTLKPNASPERSGEKPTASRAHTSSKRKQLLVKDNQIKAKVLSESSLASKPKRTKRPAV